MRMDIQNRKARFDYQILDSFEAGLELMGPEVKSIRSGQVSLQEAYVKLRGGEAWLVGAHIAPYPQAPMEGYDPTRTRKILLHKKEIVSLETKLREKGLTLLPLKMYLVRNRIKLEVGLGKGKKKYDKRESLKQRDMDKAARRKIG
jgi:SsrA-binding protein